MFPSFWTSNIPYSILFSWFECLKRVPIYRATCQTGIVLDMEKWVPSCTRQWHTHTHTDNWAVFKIPHSIILFFGDSATLALGSVNIPSATDAAIATGFRGRFLGLDHLDLTWAIGALPRCGAGKTDLLWSLRLGVNKWAENRGWQMSQFFTPNYWGYKFQEVGQNFGDWKCDQHPPAKSPIPTAGYHRYRFPYWIIITPYNPL